MEAGLKWLASHQNLDGSWSFAHSDGDRCTGFADPGTWQSNMAATGLAVSAFLNRGYTHENGKYKDSVHQGLEYLMGNMRVANGRGKLFEYIGDEEEQLLVHSIATLALAKACEMTNDYDFLAPTQLAIDYIPGPEGLGIDGWSRDPGMENNLSVVGWQVVAITAADASLILSVPKSAQRNTTKWLDSLQFDLPPGSGPIGSRYALRRSDKLKDLTGEGTALGLLCRHLLGTPQHNAGLRQGAAWLTARGPSTDNIQFNYFATQSIGAIDGRHGDLWHEWFEKMSTLLINRQVKAGKDRGSWYLDGEQGRIAGRVHATALAVMTLATSQFRNKHFDDFPHE